MSVAQELILPILSQACGGLTSLFFVVHRPGWKFFERSSFISPRQSLAISPLTMPGPISHYSQYKPTFPGEVTWPPLKEVSIIQRGQSADIRKNALLSAAGKITHLSSALGTEISGIDLRKLSNEQKDELALLVVQRGVVYFRNQDLNVHEQLDLGRYFGPLHKHTSAPIPAQPGLDEVNVVYHDGTMPKDAYNSLFTTEKLWHSDCTYELQPPGITSLKLLVGPQFGGDTLWSSSYALYSSLSTGLQTYLAGLKALHEDPQSGKKVTRRPPVETVHPVVRVHPVTGWKSIFVNPGFTTRIVGIPKAESDCILGFLFSQLSSNPEFQVRFRWEPNSVAIWDNRIVTHSAIYDYWPATRHALRVTPHGEKPLSVDEYEAKTGKTAIDRLHDREHWGLDSKSPTYL